jgi:tetratricopeptide (TPR) repeat protein
MSIVAKLRGLRAAFLFGGAQMRFRQKRFEDAARLLERVCRIKHDGLRHVELAYLGRCYLALGRYKDAVESLSAAYENYRNQSGLLKQGFDRQEYVEYLKAYSAALEKTGQSEHALKIRQEAEDYKQLILQRQK